MAVDVQAEAHGLAVEACLMLGDGGQADRHAAEALALARRLGTPRQLGQAHVAAARLAAAEGDRPAASSSFDAAIRILEDAQIPYDLAVALRGHGQLLVATPADRVRGQILIDLARSSFRRVGARPDAAASV
jgi:hypothetical protein